MLIRSIGAIVAIAIVGRPTVATRAPTTTIPEARPRVYVTTTMRSSPFPTLPLPVLCTPNPATTKLIDRVGHIGEFRWRDSTTLEIKDGLPPNDTSWVVQLVGSVVRRVTKDPHSGSARRYVAYAADNSAGHYVRIEDRKKKGSKTEVGFLYDLAPDRPVMLVHVEKSLTFDFEEVDLLTGAHIRTFTGFSTAGPNASAKYSRSGEWLIVTARNQLVIFDVASAQLKGTFYRKDNSEVWIPDWRISEDGSQLLMFDPGSTSLIDLATMQVRDAPPKMDFRLATLSGDGTITSTLGCNLLRFTRQRNFDLDYRCCWWRPIRQWFLRCACRRQCNCDLRSQALTQDRSQTRFGVDFPL